jgi:hypothetical protein
VLSEGLTAKVEATLLDRFHQPTFENTKDYDIITPEGIKLVSKKELEKGKAEFVLEAAEFGRYNIGMTVKDGISGSLMLSFEESAGPAGHVVFFVGQKYYFKDGKAVEMSDPPYLNYGHVFVPAQFIADTFAAEILPNSSPQKLLFKGKDIEMEINQTEQKITVMEKGKEKTTPIGPLFLQKKNNVYFIPAVMIGNLLGAEVDFLPKEGEIEHVTFIKKP